MRNRMKSMLLVLAVGMVLTGCTAKNPPDSGTAGDSSGNNTARVEGNTTKTDEEKVEVNKDGIVKKVTRVLIFGNSITKHGPAPHIGWNGNWGMAASAEDKDYVHVLMAKIKEYNPDTQFLYDNIADFEQKFWDYDMDLRPKYKDFNADVIIMRISENVNDTEAKNRDFAKYYAELIRFVNPSGKAAVFCTNGFWPNENVNPQIQKVCEENGYTFVDISHLYQEESNMAKELFENPDVGRHPSDQGMSNIASILWNQLVDYSKK